MVHFNKYNLINWCHQRKLIFILTFITILSTSVFYLRTPDRFNYICTFSKCSTYPNINYENTSNYFDTYQEDNSVNLTKEDYLIYTPNCHIPNIPLITSNVKNLIHRYEYKKCSKLNELTYLKNEGVKAVLFIDNKLIKSYVRFKKNFYCCYSIITRDLHHKVPDDSIKLSKCTKFESNITLSEEEEFVFVKCKNNGYVVYKNTHSRVPIKQSVLKRINATNQENKPKFNVLMIGIDSISRLNMHRNMPKTSNYLELNGWHILNGYNKIDDNTFPNLMAIFTGFDNHNAYNVCTPTKMHKLDQCPMVFYKYRDEGYVTAYGEDAAYINTFNYNKVGFYNPPTDFYLRPLMLASEKELKVTVVDEMRYCLGPKSGGERVLDYAFDFVNVYKDFPFFGFFWMNTFSHNDINSPSRMDSKLVKWLEKLNGIGIQNNTIIIFLSDHGLRFGPILETQTGWFEERLPFIYFWIPQKFKEEYPESFQNFLLNRDRLTTPYDLHMTLQDLIKKSKKSFEVAESLSCPKCQSLFEEIDINRSCEDVAINLHWCTCYGFEKLKHINNVVINATKTILKEINYKLKKDRKAKNLCEPLTLNNITEARMAKFFSHHPGSSNLFSIIFTVLPSHGKFEATVEHVFNGNHTYSAKGLISRINSYFGQSNCITNSELQKYCYCK